MWRLPSAHSCPSTHNLKVSFYVLTSKVFIGSGLEIGPKTPRMIFNLHTHIYIYIYIYILYNIIYYIQTNTSKWPCPVQEKGVCTHTHTLDRHETIHWSTFIIISNKHSKPLKTKAQTNPIHNIHFHMFYHFLCSGRRHWQPASGTGNRPPGNRHRQKQVFRPVRVHAATGTTTLLAMPSG